MLHRKNQMTTKRRDLTPQRTKTEMETNRRDKTPEGENNNDNELPGRKTKRWYETPKINK